LTVVNLDGRTEYPIARLRGSRERFMSFGPLNLEPSGRGTWSGRSVEPVLVA